MARKKEEKVNQHTLKTNPTFSIHSLSGYAVIVFLFSLLIYFNSIFNNYNLDDELVTRNHRLTSKGVSAIPEIFKSPYYQDEVGYRYEYRPVVLVAFAIEHSIFGENPHVSHFINVLLYGLLCVVLLIVLSALFNGYNLLFPLLITLFFAAHPVHTEVVASIKNRDEILSLLFGLLSLYCAIRFSESKGLANLFLVPLLFLLGILSKSTIITFGLIIPVSLILLINVPLHRLLLVTVVLTLPAVFFSRVALVSEQLLLGAGILGMTILLYYIKNGALSVNKIKAWVLEKFSLSKERAEEEFIVSTTLDFGFLKNGLVFFATVFLILFLIAGSAVAIKSGKIWMSIFPLVVFVTLFARVRTELKLLFITPISVVTLLVLINFSASSRLLEAGLIIFLVSQALSNHRSFKITVAVNYIIYVLVSLFVIESYLFLSVIVFVGFFNKKLFPATLLMLVVVGGYIIKLLFEIFSGIEHFKLAHLAVPTICAGVILFWQKKHYILFRWSAFAIPFFLGLYLFIAPPGNSTTVTRDLGVGYHTLNTIKAPDLTPVQALRPVKYMEYPIDKHDPLSVKLGTAMVILGEYLRLVVFPYPLSYYYGYAYIVPTDFWNVLPVLIFIAHLLLLGAAFFFIRRQVLISFALFFYLINISVFSGIFIPVPGMMADRFLFIPSIGFCVLLATLFAFAFKVNFLSQKLQLAQVKIPFKIISVVVLVFYSTLTISRNFDWKDHVTLFRKDIHAVEKSAQAQNLLALHTFLASNNEKDATKQLAMREEAVTHFKRALEIYPDFLNAAFDLGRTYESMQRQDRAYEAYKMAVAIDTSFYAPYFSMAVIQHNKGNLDIAIPLYEKFLLKYPYQFEAYANLSYAYYTQGNYVMAIQTNRKVLAFDPNAYQAYVNIGQTYVQMNEPDSALFYFENALRLRPSDEFISKRIEEIRRIRK